MTALVSSSERVRRPLGRLMLYATPFLLLAIGGYLSWQALYIDPRGCVDTIGALPDYPMLLYAIMALTIGRLSGYLRYRNEWHTIDEIDRRRSDLVGIRAMTIFFLAATLILIYEAIGVQQAALQNVQELEPITYYVRCAIYYDKAGATRGFATFFVVSMLCGLVGHWLWAWHPPGHRIRRLSEQ